MQSIIRVLAGIGMIVAAGIACAQSDVPVRNDTLRADGREVIMMRHAYLDEGSYDYWYQQSAAGVWPWFERLGARMDHLALSVPASASSALRERPRQEQLPESVWPLLLQHNLYGLNSSRRC